MSAPLPVHCFLAIIHPQTAAAEYQLFFRFEAALEAVSNAAESSVEIWEFIPREVPSGQLIYHQEEASDTASTFPEEDSETSSDEAGEQLMRSGYQPGSARPRSDSH